MLSEQLKRRLSSLRHRGETSNRQRSDDGPTAGVESPELLEHLPEGRMLETPRGDIFACDVGISQIHSDASRLVATYTGSFQQAARLAERGELPRYLEPLGEADPSAVALIDTETAGFHGRPLFLVGLAGYRDGDITLTQYFACNYAQEAGVLGRLAERLPEVDVLVSFNGKAFDWPFVRDRMVYHRLQCETSFAHLDLLHPSRRRWRAKLPNCKLQTLERYLCGRWRSGDIPGEEIPQRYHDFVRLQDARLIAPVFHHNRMDLITMIELLVALVNHSEDD
jgi:uncharacterized protein YprB with RNaseH-like and TPR domain